MVKIVILTEELEDNPGARNYSTNIDFHPNKLHQTNFKDLTNVVEIKKSRQYLRLTELGKALINKITENYELLKSLERIEVTHHSVTIKKRSTENWIWVEKELLRIIGSLYDIDFSLIQIEDRTGKFFELYSLQECLF